MEENGQAISGEEPSSASSALVVVDLETVSNAQDPGQAI